MELLQITNKKRQGQALVEIILAMALAAILLPALLTGLATTREGRAQQNQRLGASAYLKEAQEAVRSVREKGWSNVVPTGIYHPIQSGSTWSLSPNSETINGYTRSLVISDFLRDGNPDPSTRQITTTVSWGTPIASNVSSTFYLTRYLDNLTHVETLQAQFNAGTPNGTTTSNTTGGEVILGAGGYGDWCKPADWIVGQLDLPKRAVTDAIYGIEGEAYVGMGGSHENDTLATIQIENTNPPAPSVDGTFGGYHSRGLFGEEDYAYIATDNKDKEIVIVDLTSKDQNGNYSEIGSYNAPGDDNAKNVFVSGNVGYMVSDKVKYLYTFDLSSKIGSRPQLGSLLLAGKGTRVIVAGNYAFVTIKGATVEMQVIDITNPSSPVAVGQTDLTGKDAVDISLNSTGTRAYLVTGKQDNLPEFFIIDVSTKTGEQPVKSSFDLGINVNPKAVALVTGNKVIIAGKATNNDEEYKVIDITNETSLSECGGLNIPDDRGISGVVGVLEADGDAYSYINTGDPDSEFKIIEGGPGGRYATSGTFESAVFDTGYSTAFNYLSFTASTPPNTSLQLQVAVADPVSGNCTGAAYNYVGPDGTSNTFFSSPGGQIPLNDNGSGYENPARCLRYKAYLTTSDLFATPVLYDVTINYSP